MLQPDVFFRKNAFDWVTDNVADLDARLGILSDMIRHNIVTQVMVANTGHIGASMSAADTLTALYHGGIMHVDPSEPRTLERDVFILSKGHASPLNYAILASKGFFPDDELLRFRRLDGLQGHVDMETPGVDANTGSLAMGISKAKGHAWAMRRRGSSHRAFVMVGDGELQEGQNWEALGSAPAMKLGNLVMLVDKNLVQTDHLVEDIMPMPPVEDKLSAFGWEVHEIRGGNDAGAIRKLLTELDYSNLVPKAVILHTIKGKGISFMEHPTALAQEGMYHWHNKVPGQEQYVQAVQELRDKISKRLPESVPQDFWPVIPREFSRVATSWVDDYVVRGYTKALIELVKTHPELVALDGDLAIDCGIRALEEQTPEHFLQCGISEQDMVSMAGAMAHEGLVPVVNTFSAFLSSRSNEQMFNAQSEHGKVIYAGHLAGLIPATPGKSHQAVRDIGLIRTIPEITIAEPSCEGEAYLLTKWAVETHPRSVYIRFANCKGLAAIPLPADYSINLGQGFVLRDGQDVALIAAGPILLAQAIEASDLLAKEGMGVRIVNLPWHTDLDLAWLETALSGIERVVVLDNHVAQGGQSEEVRSRFASRPMLAKKHVLNLSVHGFAKTGQPLETLAHFGLDATGIASFLRSL